MRSHKEVKRLAGLLVLSLLLGCSNTPRRSGSSLVAQPPSRPRPTAVVPVADTSRPAAPSPKASSTPSTQYVSADAEQLPALPPLPADKPPAPLPPFTVPTTTAPTTVAPTTNSAAPLRRLHTLAAREFAGIDSYTCRLIRREEVKGKLNPQEVIRFQFRKQPWSVRFVWLDGKSKGREVVFVKGQHDNLMHTLLASGDVPLMPAGKRMALAPDSLLVRSASRHAVTEAGMGHSIDRFGLLVDAAERGDVSRGTLTYLGPQKRPESESVLEAVEQTLAPGVDSDLPRGGRRQWYFDPATRNLPVLMTTQDESGREVEYYRNDLFLFHPLSDGDFHPDKLWGKK